MSGIRAVPYQPRTDQIAAVVARLGCSPERARDLCLENHREFRDRIRYWIPATDDNGYSIRRVVDEETFLAWRQRCLAS